MCGAGVACGKQKLNVVWLSVEDMSPWINAYGDMTVPTPHLNRLAKEGVVYENAFATSPVCAPARSSLITGMFCTRIGTMQMRNGNPSKAAIAKDPEAYKDIPGYEGVPASFVRCFPEHLRAAGYYCTNNSKKDYQFKEPVTVWDESSNTAHWRNRADGQPFFAVFNHTGTHESKGFPTSKRTPEVIKPDAVPVPPFYPDTAHVRDAIARTYNNIAAMDAWVGSKLVELKEAGLLEQTVVIFFSDHGVGLPRGKRSCFDTGTRVPLIIRHPNGKDAGTRSQRVVSFIDFGPSTLSVADIEPDTRLDGTPFIGSFACERDDYRRGHAYANADRFDSVYDRSRTVSDGRYRYTRNFITNLPYIIRNAYREQLHMTAELYALEESGPQTPEQWQMAVKERPSEEFYDSQSDPWEVQNLIESKEHQGHIDKLRGHLESWIEHTGDLGFVLPETILVREKIWPPNGQQPTTPIAQTETRFTPKGAILSLTCSDPGASIGYRMSRSENFRGPWSVYTKPVEVSEGKWYFEVQTHRIGHIPSVMTGVIGNAR